MLNILKSPYFLIVVILLVSAFFRLYRISDYMEYLGDQGRDVVVVRNFLTQGNLMGIGPQTSIGNMYLGPWYYYLMALPLLIANYSPVGPSIMVAFFGIATTWLIWKFTKKLFSNQTAIIAALLFAISPVAIKYTSFSWNPNIMPFFSLLFIYSLYQVFFKKKTKYLLLASLAFIFCLNSHYLAILLLPLPLFLLLKYPPSDKSFIKYLIIAVFMFILSLVPQILFDLKHHGQNINAIITFFTVRQTTVNLKLYKAIPEMVPLYHQIVSRLGAGKNEILGIFISIILFLALTTEFFQKRFPRRYFFLVFFWFFIGLVGLCLYKQHIYDHYFAFLFPPVFILLALALARLRFLGTIILIIIIIFSLLENPLRYSPNRQLAVNTEIVNTIIDKSNHQPFNFALMAKQNYDPPYRYLFELKRAPIFLLADNKTDQLFVVCEPFQTDCQPLGNPLWDIAAFGQAQITSSWKVNEISVFRLQKTIPTQ